MRKHRAAAALAPLVVVLGAGPAAAAAGAWAERPQTAVRLVSPWRTAPRAGELRLGLHVRLGPGWHSYWRSGGDAGLPPEVDWSATPDLREARLLFPAPRRYELPGGLVAFGYEGEVVYPMVAVLGGSAGAAPALDLRAEVDYLVCADTCVPYRESLALHQPLAETGEPDPETGPLLAAWEARVPRPDDEVDAVATHGRLLTAGAGAPALVVEVEGQAGDPAAWDLFVEPPPGLAAGRPSAEPGSGSVRFTVPLTPRDARAPLPERADFAWTLTGLTLPQGVQAVEARRTVTPSGAPKAAAGRAARSPVVAGAVALVIILAALARRRRAARRVP